MTRNSHQIPSTINCIRVNHDIIKGIRDSLERELLISHSPSYVDNKMEKIDYIIEHAIECGIDLERNSWGEEIKNKLWEARRLRE